MSKDLVIFKAVANETDKQILLKKLVQQKGTLFLKNKKDRSFIFQVIEVSDSLHLRCSHQHFNPMDFQSSEYFSATFTLGHDKYLFDTHPLVHDSGVTLSVKDLFHLQRRHNFRYTLPDGNQAPLTVLSVNHLNSEYQGWVLDINAVGCAVKLENNAAELHQHDHLQVEVRFASRPPLRLNAVVKNLRLHDETDLVLGLEFENIMSSQEDQIVEAINDLQRQLYFRKVG